MITTKNDRCPTIKELLDVSWCIQMHADGDLAFVFDATGDIMLAIIESTGQQLPPLGRSPAEVWVRSGDHLLLESFQSRQSMAVWLTRCRDRASQLAFAKSPVLRHWWADGCNRLTGDQVASWLEV